MKKKLIKLWNAFVSAPGNALIALTKFVSPFKVENPYIRSVYRKNINLFRIHLALAIVVMVIPVTTALVFLLSLASVKCTYTFLADIAGDLYYEGRAVFRPIARGFKEGLPRD